MQQLVQGYFFNDKGGYDKIAQRRYMNTYGWKNKTALSQNTIFPVLRLTINLHKLNTVNFA